MHRLYRELCCISALVLATVDNCSIFLWITGLINRPIGRETGKGKGSGGAFLPYLFVKKDRGQIVCTYASYCA
jgi:hypothetical protein